MRPSSKDPKTDIRNWRKRKIFILNVLHNEESQFNKTIDQGLKILADLETEMKEAGKTVLSGSDAFQSVRYLRISDGSDQRDPGRKRIYHR